MSEAGASMKPPSEEMSNTVSSESRPPEITLTVLSHAVHFQNGDEVKRLFEVGRIRPRSSRKGRVGTLPKRKMQQHIFKRLKIRDLDHYREVIGNPRSPGLTIEFQRGSVLSMELTSHPERVDEFSWYAIVDTAIGGTVGFIDNLRAAGSIQINSRCVPAVTK